MIPSQFETLSSDVAEFLHDKASSSGCLSEGLMLHDTANTISRQDEPYRTLSAIVSACIFAGTVDDLLSELRFSLAVHRALKKLEDDHA